MESIDLFDSLSATQSNFNGSESAIGNTSVKGGTSYLYPYASNVASISDSFHSTSTMEDGGLQSLDDQWNVSSLSDSVAMDTFTNETDHLTFDDELALQLYLQYNLTNRLYGKIPQYYSLAYQIIGTFFQGIIFIVGMWYSCKIIVAYFLHFIYI